MHIGILMPKKLTGFLRCQFQVSLNASLQFYLQCSWAGWWSTPTKSVSPTFIRTQKISLHFLSYSTKTASKIQCFWELLDLKMLTACTTVSFVWAITFQMRLILFRCKWKKIGWYSIFIVALSVCYGYSKKITFSIKSLLLIYFLSTAFKMSLWY